MISWFSPDGRRHLFSGCNVAPLAAFIATHQQYINGFASL
ncbi:MAG: hypothetical protein ACJAZ5_001433 [Alloalcanivorax venustensis]|jgi:hypothetical protein